MTPIQAKPNDLELYNREASNWWKPGSALHVLQSMNPPRFSFFDRYVSHWPNLKVLDVGCGGGFTSEFLASRGALVTGVDPSALSIETAKHHAAQNSLQIDYRVGVGEKLPLPDKSFDVVVCVDVLEHVTDLAKVLSEINRVLTPGGLFLFDTINKTFKSKVVMIWMLEKLLKHIPNGTHDWNMFIPPADLEKALLSSGFSKPELAGFDVQGVDKKNGRIRATINNNMSVMYIGACKKVLPG